jgi:opacity protein-like surface antigen
VLYLPVPIVDVYVKAGLSRIKTDFTSTYEEYIPGTGTCAIGHPDCSVIGVFTATRDSTDTSFAYGAGLQWKLGDWAVRGEYERFDAAGANPSLLSIGMTYWIH